MIYILTEKGSNRLEYISEVIFKYILKVDFKIVDKSFKNFEDNPVINYSPEIQLGLINIVPHTLLFENDIRTQDITLTFKKEVPYFFKTSDEATLQYDVFASSFFLISRYEEYLPFVPDTHGRFPAKNALSYRAGILKKPVCHLWAERIKKEILKKYPDYNFPITAFHQINSIDIDTAYAYKGRPILWQIGSITKNLVTFNFKEIKNKLQYYFLGIDPYNTYSYLKQQVTTSGLPTLFFLELGKYGKHDKNIPFNPTYKKLVSKLSGWGKIGIHPSYQSNKDSNLLKKEKDKLSVFLKEEVINSRQHYLILKFPETYENLIINGIRYDYSMGYADETGFRSGMCVMYPFFNLVMITKSSDADFHWLVLKG